MSTLSNLAAGRLKAAKSYTELMRQAAECASIHEKEGIPLPDGLLKLLGLEQGATTVALTGVSASGQLGFVQASSQPLPLMAAVEEGSFRPYRRPADIPADWISIDPSVALVITQVQTIAYSAGVPMKIRDIVGVFASRGQDIADVQINSIGTRLRRRRVIDFTDSGWVLCDRSNTLREVEGRIWGPVSAFNDPEVAAHRRETIVWFLKNHPSMQRVQLRHLIGKADWLEPKAQELLYSDLSALVRAGLLKKPATGEPTARLILLEPQKGPAPLRLATQM